MKKYIYILFTVTLLISCEKASNLQIPNSDPQLVVSYFVGPNLYSDTTYLNLNWSAPIYDNPDYYEQINWREYDNSVKSADVIINKNGEEFKLEYNETTKAYVNTKTDFGVGDKVELIANYNNQKQLRANCVVPEKPILEVEVVGESVDEDGTIYHTIKYTSLNEGKNYFKFFMKSYKTKTATHYYIPDVGYIDSTYQRVVENKIYLTDPIVILEKNESVVFSTNRYLGEVCNEKADSIITYALNIDENYYRFENMPKDNHHEDGIYLLFVGEPELDFTNIEGGLGIFCAFNMDVITTHFE